MNGIVLTWSGLIKSDHSQIWSMYEEENTRRLRESVVKDEAYFKMRDKKLKVENELRFFKSDFAKMVLAKEEAFPSWPVQNMFLLN